MKIINLKAMNCRHVEFLLGLINVGFRLASSCISAIRPWRSSHIAIKQLGPMT